MIQKEYPFATWDGVIEKGVEIKWEGDMDFFELPKDVTLYKVLTDFGAIIGAIVTLIAAITAYVAIRAQIGEARKEDREHREIELQNRARERLIGATLVDTALEVLKFDLNRVRNTFDPGTTDKNFNETTIEAARAQLLRERLRALILEPVLPYIDKLEHQAIAEYIFIAMITERAREEDRPVTYGEFRQQLATIEARVATLQTDVKAQAKSARASLGSPQRS